MSLFPQPQQVTITVGFVLTGNGAGEEAGAGEAAGAGGEAEVRAETKTGGRQIAVTGRGSITG